jgi:hypothetical protein
MIRATAPSRLLPIATMTACERCDAARRAKTTQPFSLGPGKADQSTGRQSIVSCCVCLDGRAGSLCFRGRKVEMDAQGASANCHGPPSEGCGVSCNGSVQMLREWALSVLRGTLGYRSARASVDAATRCRPWRPLRLLHLKASGQLRHMSTQLAVLKPTVAHTTAACSW